MGYICGVDYICGIGYFCGLKRKVSTRSGTRRRRGGYGRGRRGSTARGSGDCGRRASSIEAVSVSPFVHIYPQLFPKGHRSGARASAGLGGESHGHKGATQKRFRRLFHEIHGGHHHRRHQVTTGSHWRIREKWRGPWEYYCKEGTRER